MLLVLFMYVTATIAVNNENCDNFVRVNNAEVTTLLSPNYPQKEPPGSSCRWTVFADLGRRIILVCPFYSQFEVGNLLQNEFLKTLMPNLDQKSVQIKTGGRLE